MRASSETVSNLLGLLYEASASPEQWPIFLDALSVSARADSAYFVLVDPEGICNFTLNPGFDPAFQRAYSEYFYRHDVLLDRFVAAQQQYGDWIGTSQSVISDREYFRSPIYNDCIKPQGQLYHCAAALGGLDGGLEGGLGMQRSPRAAPFSDATVALLALLAPHLKRALNTHRALSQARCHNEELLQTVETLGHGFVSLDALGRVIRMSAAAQTILDAEDGILLEERSLRASVPGEQAKLAAIVSGAVATGAGRGSQMAVSCPTTAAPQAGSGPLWTPSSGGAMLVSRTPPRRPLQVVVTPFRSSLVLLDDRPAALVFLGDPDARPASRTGILRALYGLTPTEARLANLLAEGHDVATAAQGMKISTQTARFHLKNVFRKAAVSRQPELVRLVLGLPGERTRPI
jgi:DNA-binding CsgD family transcriptional regulator/PAS domain-containing protein